MKQRYASIVLLVFLLLAGLMVKYKLQRAALPTSGAKKLHVVASFYPLYFLAREIGGDQVDVTNITPAGAEPHDYEPSTGDIAQIEQSQVLFLNGGQLEPWGETIKDTLKEKKTVVVAVGEKLVTKALAEEGVMRKDPHTWLDPQLFQTEAETVANTLVQADPIHATTYRANVQALQNKLVDLDKTFHNALTSCQKKDIVTSHAAFGYLAHRYHLVQVPISGLSPDAEPSPKELAAVAQLAREHNVTHIFFETLVSPRLAETIAREVGAKTLVLNPLEGLTQADQGAGKDYISVQKENVQNLRSALICP